jgi:hypothetical protein
MSSQIADVLRCRSAFVQNTEWHSAMNFIGHPRLVIDGFAALPQKLGAFRASSTAPHGRANDPVEHQNEATHG